MKLTKILLSTLSAATLAFSFSACGSSPGGNATVNNANQSNTATVVNVNQITAIKTPANNSNTAPSANKPATKPNAESSGEETTVSGKMMTGKTESLIMYVGMETGDYAAYCFDTDSEAGRAISAACKSGDECEVTGEVVPGKCNVPGLEADLSDSGRIVKVTSAKSLGPQKRAK